MRNRYRTVIPGHRWIAEPAVVEERKPLPLGVLEV